MATRIGRLRAIAASRAPTLVVGSLRSRRKNLAPCAIEESMSADIRNLRCAAAARVQRLSEGEKIGPPPKLYQCVAGQGRPRRSRLKSGANEPSVTCRQMDEISCSVGALANDLEPGELLACQRKIRLQLYRLFVILVCAANVAQCLVDDGAVIVRDLRFASAHVDAFVNILQGDVVLLEYDVGRAAIDVAFRQRRVERQASVVITQSAIWIGRSRTQDAAIDECRRPVAN